MVDSINKETRSWNMSRIKSKNTKPEIILRSLLHNMGYRFRLQGKVSVKKHPKGYLPGKPDIVLSKYKTVFFIHGCFWHMHQGCKRSTIPKSNSKYWKEKLNRNVIRDKEIEKELKKMEWNVVVFWECEMKNMINVKNKIKAFLNQ